MRLLDELAAQATRPDNVRALTATIAVLAQGRADLDIGDGRVPGVPIADCYPDPQVGDVALVVKIGSTWLVLTSLGKGAGKPNLIRTSPGFEAGGDALAHFPIGWEEGDWSGDPDPSPSIQALTGDAHSGEYGLQIKNASGASGTQDLIVQRTDLIPVDPGETYEFGFWARATTLSGGPSCGFTVLEYVGGSLTGSQLFGGFPDLSKTWDYYSATYTPTVGTTQAIPVVSIRPPSSSGYAVLDDVYFGLSS